MKVFQEETGLTVGEIAEIAEVTSSAVSQWLGNGGKIIHSIGSIRAAIYLERKTGFSALWLAKGEGQPKVERQEPCAPAPTPARPWPLGSDLHDRLMALDKKWLGHIEIKLDEAITECEARSGKEQAA